jgi:hypothetical protein
VFIGLPNAPRVFMRPLLARIKLLEKKLGIESGV